MKELIKLQLSTQLRASIKDKGLNSILQKFSSVRIKDSTRFQIDESLRESYPGSNGGASGAGVHVQFEFDLLNSTVVDLDVTNALKQDNTDAIEKKGQINRGDLIIRDLGYSSTEVFEHIISQGAFFLNRLPQDKFTLNSATICIGCCRFSLITLFSPFQMQKKVSSIIKIVIPSLISMVILINTGLALSLSFHS